MEKEAFEFVEKQLHERIKKIPENVFPTIITAIILAEKREKEKKGSYQTIIDLMYEANGLPRVIFPPDVQSMTEREEEDITVEMLEDRIRRWKQPGCQSLSQKNVITIGSDNVLRYSEKIDRKREIEEDDKDIKPKEKKRKFLNQD